MKSTKTFPYSICIFECLAIALGQISVTVCLIILWMGRQWHNYTK